MQYSDSSPQRAKNVANAIAEAFVEVAQEIRTQQAAQVVDVLKNQLDLAEAKLKGVRDNFDKFRTSKNILGPVTTEAEAASRRLLDARIKRDDVKQRLADAQ